MIERIPDYPPEYDLDGCELCGDETECDCPECPKCGVVGDPYCYIDGHLEPAGDSIAALCHHIGIEPIGLCLRAIDKHNTEHVWLVLRGSHERVYCHNHKRLAELLPHVRLELVGVGGIAWDGSDWEYSEEVEAGGDWSALDRARDNFNDALAEHQALEELYDDGAY